MGLFFQFALTVFATVIYHNHARTEMMSFFSVCVHLCVRYSVESVNDGLFHTVELLIQNHSLSLVVDNSTNKSLGKLARQPSVDHNTQLYIGGTHTHFFINTIHLRYTDVTLAYPTSCLLCSTWVHTRIGTHNMQTRTQTNAH